jgi:predicted O-linked N-acetylglucosamine transferase (SPINDLY family)
MNPAQLQRLIQEAVAHHHAGRLEQAAGIYQRIRQILPNNFDAVQLLGVIALQQGKPAEAAELLARAFKLNPKSAVCAMRLGVALNCSGRAVESEHFSRLAVQLDPNFAEGWSNLAASLKSLDRLREAIECHHRALTLKPDFAMGWYNYGLTLCLFGRFMEALRAHDRALAADPTYAKGHYGRAQAFQQSYRIPEAIEAYDRYLELEPGCHEARSYRLLALNNLDTLSREQLFAEHVKFNRAAGTFPVPAFRQEPAPDRRLRVAFLSPDLREHSCAYFLEPILRHLDPEQFELYLYHDHFRVDAVSERFKALASVWRNFVSQPNSVVEQTIRADEPDIIIDLAGHTGMTTRLSIFARHLAPVQINYLGYPNTTGLTAMHYRFTDAVADPHGDADAFASEELVRFSPSAWVYQPPDSSPEINPLPSAAGGPVTFGCFNNLAKINDATLALWARVLAAVPASRLLLKGWGLTDQATRQNYLARFAAAGLPSDRIDLCERTAEVAEHLSLYHRVDISLDTFPYHGTTTTCESLWMGVPVVTLLGDRHASRVSASLLTAAGHPEWIARMQDDYVRLAATLSADRPALARLRAGLRNEMKAGALCAYAGQGARFGDALRQCWRRHCQRAAALAVA